MNPRNSGENESRYGVLYQRVNGMGDSGGIIRDAIDEVEFSLSGRVLIERRFFDGRTGDGRLYGGALFQVSWSGEAEGEAALRFSWSAFGEWGGWRDLVESFGGFGGGRDAAGG